MRCYLFSITKSLKILIAILDQDAEVERRNDVLSRRDAISETQFVFEAVFCRFIAKISRFLFSFSTRRALRHGFPRTDAFSFQLVIVSANFIIPLFTQHCYFPGRSFPRIRWFSLTRKRKIDLWSRKCSFSFLFSIRKSN